MNNWRPDKERIEAIAQELNINLPDIAIWWINGATPENVPIGNNSSQWFKFIADNKEREKRDKELLGSLKLDTSVFGKIPPTELKKPVDGFFSHEHNNKIPVAHFRQEMERKRKEKQRRDEELKNIQVQAHLEALRQFEAEKQQANQQPELMPDAGEVDKSGKPDDEKEFNLRLAALRRWMTNKGLEPCSEKPVKLKHYPKFKDFTKSTLYAELCGFDRAFYMAEATFNDFWQEQQLLKFK